MSYGIRLMGSDVRLAPPLPACGERWSKRLARAQPRPETASGVRRQPTEDGYLSSVVRHPSSDHQNHSMITRDLAVPAGAPPVPALRVTTKAVSAGMKVRSSCTWPAKSDNARGGLPVIASWLARLGVAEAA